jgi:hypothetical protein
MILMIVHNETLWLSSCNYLCQVPEVRPRAPFPCCSPIGYFGSSKELSTEVTRFGTWHGQGYTGQPAMAIIHEHSTTKLTMKKIVMLIKSIGVVIGMDVHLATFSGLTLANDLCC